MVRVNALAALSLLALASAPLSAARAQDAAAGQRVFAQCRVCHIADATERNGPQGPNLQGIVGRQAAQRPGQRYSANMQQLGAAGHIWNEENLRAYLTNPKAVVPQGTMSFNGIRNEQQLNDLIAYLKSISPGS